MGDLSRYVAAAGAAIETLSQRFGAFPQPSITMVDPPFAGTGRETPADITLPRTPWLSVRTAMAPELAVTRGISRWYWRELVGPRMPGWFVDGLAELVARQMTVGLFERVVLPGGYAVFEQRVFGGLVPRAIGLRMDPDTNGEPLGSYRANPGVAVTARPQVPADARSLQAKTVFALGTLERWLGGPSFDQALSEFARQKRGQAPDIADFFAVVSDASGQDLTWLYDQAFQSSATFDYAIERLTSEPKGGSFETTVVVTRQGGAMFTGSSAKPDGSFESGRGVPLRVVFVDGETRTDYWDGRSASKTFVYKSPGRAISAELDPDHVLLLDLHPANNSRTLAPRAGVAATMWAARWLGWLEDWLLTCALLS